MHELNKALMGNIFVFVVVVIYSVFLGKHLYRRMKYSGKVEKRFKHRSATRTMGYIMVFFGVFYCLAFLMDKNKNLGSAVQLALFVYFVIIVSMSSVQDIIIYENGLYYSGKFAKFDEMDTVTKVGRNGIQIKMLKKGMGDSLYMSKVVEEKDFIALVRKKMKLAKREKRRQQRMIKKSSGA